MLSVENSSIFMPPSEETSPREHIVYMNQHKFSDKINSSIRWSLLNSVCCLCGGIGVLMFSIPALVISLKAEKNFISGNYGDVIQYLKYSSLLNLLGTLLVIFCLISFAFFAYFLFKNDFKNN